MIKRDSISILLLFVSFLAQSAFAQTASTTGTIKDSSGGRRSCDGDDSITGPA